MTEQSPQLSPDGRFRWDGHEWVPVAPGAGPYPYPGYNQQVDQQSAKRNTLTIVLLSIIGVLILAIGGCAAAAAILVGGINDAIEEAAERDSRPGGPANPLTITEGEAFGISGFDYRPGWTVTEVDGFLGIEGLKLRNNRAAPDSAFVQIKLLSGSAIVGSADCLSEEVAVGQVVRLSCTSGDKTAPYDTITINDVF